MELENGLEPLWAILRSISSFRSPQSDYKCYFDPSLFALIRVCSRTWRFVLKLLWNVLGPYLSLGTGWTSIVQTLNVCYSRGVGVPFLFYFIYRNPTVYCILMLMGSAYSNLLSQSRENREISRAWFRRFPFILFVYVFWNRDLFFSGKIPNKDLRCS